MTKKRISDTDSDKIVIKFDDSFVKDFQQKVFSGEFASDEEAIDYLKKDFKKNHLEIDL